MGADTCGNPCVVEDRDTGVVWLLLSWNPGEDQEDAFVTNRGRDTRRAFVTSSSDDGQTWSRPVEITEAVKDPSMGWYGTGPGIGVQLAGGPHRGRLVIPGDHTYSDPKGNVAGGPYEWGAHIIYSDDHGRSWHLGGVVRPKVGEPQVAELPGAPGSLLMNARSFAGRHRRAQALSQDGGNSWSAPADAPDLVEPPAQGSLISVRKGAGAILLFANPASEFRVNLVVRRSANGGLSWSRGLSVHSGPSAYSSMAELPGGRVAILFEAGEKSPYERIDFARVAIDAIP